jgi:ATP-dependent protease HslVU (ClpYQ) ATPase subunit
MKMQQNIYLNLTKENIENLEEYSKKLNSDVNTIFNEALQFYFEKIKEQISNHNNDEFQNTNLDFNEFWDGVDLD